MYVEIGGRGVSGLGVTMEEIDPHNDTAPFSVMEVIASFLLLGFEIE